ncbi:hypothetical protein HDR60_01575 [bacterium]|nr:hypothetical protein [bacterium]MDE6224487.1 DUF1367 family protein [Alphaproteobacteria bacterium]
MRKILILFLILFSMVSLNSYAEGFMSAFEEIPLQDGLSEEEPFSYDNEDIRIIEQYVSSSNLSKDEFLKFYRETLKSLGWNEISQKGKNITFKREDEALILTIESETPLVVLFSLKPFGK